MKTYSPKAKEIKRKWYLVNAQGKVLGRLATRIAHILMGKHKPSFAYHLDCGDYVVVVNAQKVKVTGKKLENKVYRHHTGYMGGLKEIVLKDLLIKKPEEVIRKAVWGMLPKNKLRKKRIARLKIFAQAEHPFGEKKLEELK